MTIKVIHTSNAPEPIGCYSQAIQTGNLIFLSGQIGLDPSTLALASGGCKEQLQQTFNNIEAILATQRATFANIIKLTVYLKEIADWPLVNEVMKDRFEEPYPARTVIQAAGLPKNGLVEIEVIASI